MKKTGLNGYVYEFYVDYNGFNMVNRGEAIPVIYNYFMLKNDLK